MRLLFFISLIFLCGSIQAQELFPHTEIASSVPKGVIGLRIFGESYDEFGAQRNMGALKIMYGATSKLSVSVTGTVSNHHSGNLPTGLITHTHVNSDTIYQTGSFTRGIHYPYRFNGVYAFAKYRIVTIDGQNTHFRVGLFAEGSYINSAHDEAEPNLLDDTKGWGSGFMTTYLYKHFAVSFNTGVIIPGTYKEVTPDFYGGDLHTELTYGKAIQYNLSFGYLVYPRHYKTYKETNINVYLEFMGKSYESAKVIQNNRNIEPKTDLLLKGNYIEMHPGIQAIIDSNLRIDFAVGFPVLNKSYTRFYPVFLLGIQRYFFFK
ncbi:MAG: hypothetical protein U0X76_12975 [Bacteroidia bacterium]